MLLFAALFSWLSLVGRAQLLYVSGITSEVGVQDFQTSIHTALSGETGANVTITQYPTEAFPHVLLKITPYRVYVGMREASVRLLDGSIVVVHDLGTNPPQAIGTSTTSFALAQNNVIILACFVGVCTVLCLVFAFCCWSVSAENKLLKARERKRFGSRRNFDDFDGISDTPSLSSIQSGALEIVPVLPGHFSDLKEVMRAFHIPTKIVEEVTVAGFNTIESLTAHPGRSFVLDLDCDESTKRGLWQVVEYAEMYSTAPTN